MEWNTYFVKCNLKVYDTNFIFNIFRPSMKKGFVDASVQVLGLNFLQDKNNTYVYYTVTSILPKKIGNHKVCVQNVNAAG